MTDKLVDINIFHKIQKLMDKREDHINLIRDIISPYHLENINNEHYRVHNRVNFVRCLLDNKEAIAKKIETIADDKFYLANGLISYFKNSDEYIQWYASTLFKFEKQLDDLEWELYNYPNESDSDK